MTEQEAIKLLDNLKNFMETTNKQIETLINRTHNLKVELDNLSKRIFKLEGNRLIIN